MAVETSKLEAPILARTRRVVVTGEPGDGAAARQFDAVALCAGFKCSRDLLERLSRIEPGRVMDIAAAALEVVREQAGDHVRHNSYFLEFPGERARHCGVLGAHNRQFCSSDARGFRPRLRMGHTALLSEITEAGSRGSDGGVAVPTGGHRWWMAAA